ncbi:MAG: hypothetical protein AABX47_06135 [Nanoarchaeota archaeon]
MSVCPVCSKELSDKSTLCVACGTPHDQECWDYNGKQCATFACGSKVQGKEVVTIDDFVEKHLTPVYDRVAELLWRTTHETLLWSITHEKEFNRFRAIYSAGLNGVISPSNAHNQLLEGLMRWKSYYYGRLESLRHSSPEIDDIVNDVISSKDTNKHSDCHIEIGYLRAINQIADALEAPDLRLEEKVYSRNEVRLDIGLGMVHLISHIAASLLCPPVMPITLENFEQFGF